VVRHAVTSHRQISGNAVTSAFTAIHPVLNRNQRRYHVKKRKVFFFNFSNLLEENRIVTYVVTRN
jgi:hypothetical protein